MRESLNQARTILEGRGPFLLTSHKRPDGDAIGSTLGLAAWLDARGAGAFVVSSDGVPAPYGFVPGAGRVIERRPDDLTDYVLVAVDAPDGSRLAVNPEDLAGAATVLNIDHHPDNTLYGTLNIVDADASSASLVVYEILSPLGGIGADAANCLYLGLMTDTGGFRFSNTCARTFDAAARLVELGAAPSAASRGVYAGQPLGRLRLLGMVLASAELELGGRVAVLTLTDEMRKSAGSTGEGIEGLASYGRLLAGVDIAVLLREEGESVRVSLRSVDGVDVNAVARGLGGGGHRVAAGVVVAGPIESARRRIVEAVARYFDGDA